MLHLAYTVYQQLSQREEYKILIIGAEGAGKSTLLEKAKEIFGKGKLRTLPRNSITPTVGLNIARLDVAGRHMLLWDLGGHPSLRSLWSNYYPQCHAIVFVVDSTNPARVREAASLLRGIFSNQALAAVPVLIVANRSDMMESALSAHEMLAKLDLVDLVLRPPVGSARVRINAAAGGGDTAAEELEAATPWFGWELTEALRGTSGIGGRAYRCVAASGYTGDGIAVGLEWLAEFLSLNARAVETL